MIDSPRVAFLTDSFHEVNGVAMTSRQFEAYAKRQGLPFLCVRAAPESGTPDHSSPGVFELERGPISFRIDRRQRHDLALWRHRRALADAFRQFKPDLVHITGPSDVGQLGALVAHQLRIPLVASWHTDLHKFAARRLDKALRLSPGPVRKIAARLAEKYCLRALMRFYKIPRVLLAPNQESIELLENRTGKPVYLMRRGVDTDLFSPARRDRDWSEFTIGYVGRLTPEKNVRLLADVERALAQSGKTGFRFLIVGDGYERAWLERRMAHARFAGMLTGSDLARAYANMDLLLFPSRTDTFGNVVLEALSSGTPAVVTSDGGPKYLVRNGLTGIIASTDADFVESVVALSAGTGSHQAMRERARRFALENSWDKALEAVYRAYDYCLKSERRSAAQELHEPRPVASRHA